MKNPINHLRFLVVLVASALAVLVQPARAQSVWNAFGGSSTDTNWSTAGNWAPTGTPGPGTNVLFGASTAVFSLAVPNNFVDQNFTVASLQYSGASSGDNVTLVGNGNTLTVTNGLTAGITGSFIGYDVIAGAATLVLTNGGTLLVDAAFGSAQPANSVTLDLSGLNNLVVTNVPKILVGVRGAAAPYNANNEQGILYLAKTNVIALTGTGTGATNALLVGWNANAGLNCALYLGQTNIIFADTVAVGSFKTTGCLLAFQNGLNSPVAYFRGRAAASTSRVLYWGVGDVTGTSNAGSGCSGTNDFTGGFVDALVDKLDVAVGTVGTSGASASGTLTFNAGTIDANIVTNAWSLGTGGSPVNNGVINVNGTGTLRVNTALVMGQTSVGTGTANAALNVTNGTVCANTIIRGTGAGTVAINLGSATLVISNTAGTPATPINTFNIAGSTLTLSPLLGGTNISAGTLTASGVNTINIGSVPLVFSYPAQYHLIGYAASPGDLTTFALGSLPAGSPVYQGYISNNPAGGSIDLVLTTGPLASNPPPPPKTVTWNGTPGGNWNTNTANWTSGGQPAIYTNLTTSGSGDLVTFDDSLKGTTNVNLTTVLTPGSLLINNSQSNYVFSGTGRISGTVGLVKEGTASLTLAETGGDNFSGGILASNGTLTLDDTNSIISGGTVVANGAVLQLGNNDANGVFPAGFITNNGTLIFDRNDSALTVGTIIAGTGALTVNGSGTVTLSAAEIFTGATTVNNGTLALAGPNQTSSGLATSTSLVVNNGGTVLVDSDNALAGTTGAPALQIVINAGGTLTGLGSANGGGGTSCHIHSPLTLNGGTLGMGGSQTPAQTHGSWDLEGGVNVPGGPVTAVISALNVDPDGGGGTAFNVTNGTTPSGIDLNVTGTLNNPSAQHDTGIIKNGPGTMQLCGSNTFAGGTTINGGILLLNNSNAVQNSTVTVNANNSLQFAAGIGTFNVGNLGGANSLVLSDTNGGAITLSVGNNNASPAYSGGLGGNGAFTKVGAGSLTLSGTNTYTGNTTINAGTLLLAEPANITNGVNITIASGATLDVNQRADQALTLNSGQNLFGSGSLNGSLTNNPGSRTFVGGVGAVGSLAVSGTAALQGTLYMDVTSDGTSFDVLQAPTIVFGGTLVVSNLDNANPFAVGQSFQLFSGSCSGAFANIVPATPGPGLNWDTGSLASSGTLNIIAGATQPGITSVVLSGTNLVFSGSNGSLNGSFSVLTTTNLLLPLGRWTTNFSSQFDGAGNFSVTNGVNPAAPQQFYILQTP
jgi:fibronectin-binding autotransporter adhesin